MPQMQLPSYQRKYLLPKLRTTFVLGWYKMSKVKPLPPVKIKINLWNKVKLLLMVFISFMLWIALVVTGLNLFAYYVFNVKTKGFFDQESLKYAVVIIVGAYFCLILDKNKIYDALNIKRDLPFITIEQIKEQKKWYLQKLVSGKDYLLRLEHD